MAEYDTIKHSEGSAPPHRTKPALMLAEFESASDCMHGAEKLRDAGYANFDSGAIHVAQGDAVTGAVTFQVPEGVTVSKVQWSALSGFGSMVEWDVHG